MTKKDERVLAEINSQNIFDVKEFNNLYAQANTARAHEDYRMLDEILKSIKSFFKRRFEYFKEKAKGRGKVVLSRIEHLRKEDEARQKEIQHYFDDVAVI